MYKRNNDFDFDFTPIGLAIKKTREAQGMTWEQLARICNLVLFPQTGQRTHSSLFILANYPKTTK